MSSKKCLPGPESYRDFRETGPIFNASIDNKFRHNIVKVDRLVDQTQARFSYMKFSESTIASQLQSKYAPEAVLN